MLNNTRLHNRITIMSRCSYRLQTKKRLFAVTTLCRGHKRNPATVARRLPYTAYDVIITVDYYSIGYREVEQGAQVKVLIMPRNKSSKKKSAVKASRYVLPPPSPVGTRSKSSGVPKSSGNQVTELEVTVPPVEAPPAAVTEVFDNSCTSKQLQDMETRWDARFSQMETAIRSGLSSSSGSAGSVTDQATGVVSPSPAATVRPKDKSSKKTSSSKKKVRERSPSLDPSSSSDSDVSSSSSSSSESESESESSSTKTKKKKKGKYNAPKYLDEGDKIDCFESSLS